MPRVRHGDGRGHVTGCWIDALNHIDTGRPERARPGGVDPADYGVPEPVSAAPPAGPHAVEAAGISFLEGNSNLGDAVRLATP